MSTLGKLAEVTLDGADSTELNSFTGWLSSAPSSSPSSASLAFAPERVAKRFLGPWPPVGRRATLTRGRIPPPRAVASLVRAAMCALGSRRFFGEGQIQS